MSTLVASGSVKDIYRWPGEATAVERSTSGSAEPPLSLLQFRFSDRFSVFDWGSMPQTIPGKGEALAWIAASLFERLEREGIRTHYRGISSAAGWRGAVSDLNGAATGIVVDEVEIVPPVWVELDSNFAYPQAAWLKKPWTNLAI